MRLIGLTCFAAMALACSPATAGCYGYKFIIGIQFPPGTDLQKERDKAVEAKYDLRGETFDIAEKPNKRAGTIQNFCDTGTVVVREKRRGDGSAPSASNSPAGKPDESKKPEGGAGPAGSTADDEGICWLEISVGDVKGVCFRRGTSVEMQGKIY
jgi:hypothetical protein